MRNIGDVIDKMLWVIPKSELNLRAGLEGIIDSVRYSPPENVQMWWQELTILINDNLPPSLEKCNNWQRHVALILMDRD